MILLESLTKKRTKVNKHFKYLKYLLKHKFYVTRECFRQGIYWRGLVHDLSKFSFLEWNAYVNYFYGEYQPYDSFSSGCKSEFDCWSISKEGVQSQFDYAWLNHQNKNKHHYQYWILINDDNTATALDMPYEYILEMICDWIGAGLAITGKREYKTWYENNKDKMILSDNTRITVEAILERME